MKLTAEQRVERTHVQLMQDPDFCLFSGVFMIGKVEISDVMPTACTNGRDVIYGRAFVESLNNKELAFLVLHEAMHKAYRHLMVWQKIAKENPMLANLAMDYVINLQLVDYNKPDIIQMPRDKEGNLMGALDEKYRGMDTKQVFDLLKQETKDEPSDGNGGSGSGGNEPGSGSPQPGQQDRKSKCLDDHDWENAQEMTEEEKKGLSDEVDRALREGAMLAGRMKGNLSKEINELLHPKVDWKEALREFIKTTMMGNDNSTWRRPHKRYIGMNIVMPSYRSAKIGRIVVGVDTSGSIGSSELSQFLGEVKSICNEVQPDGIDLLYWDSHVAKHEAYNGNEIETLVETTKPAGGGGTEPECVPQYMKKEALTPQCTVMLTDGFFYGGGCGDWSGVDSPVLWCVKGNKSFVPSVGKSVYVEV
jgi:predicted metal-dependent peptidase